VRYVFNWSGKYPLWLVESSIYRFIELDNMFKIRAKKWATNFSMNGRAFSYSLGEDKKALEEISKLYLDKNFADKVFEESKKIRDLYWSIVDRIRKLELDKLSDKEAFDVFSNLHRFLSKIFCFFDITRPEYYEYMEERLRSLVKKYFNDGDIINKLVLPTEQDEITKGYNELLLLCVSSPSDKELLDYGYKNIWLFPDIKDENELLGYLRGQKIEIQKKSSEEVKKKISESQTILKKKEAGTRGIIQKSK